jgi:hypothetical protein
MLKRNNFAVSLALALIGQHEGGFAGRYVPPARKLRTPDESIRRRDAAAAKRGRKAQARLRCKANGGWSTLAERTAAGVPGAAG